MPSINRIVMRQSSRRWINDLDPRSLSVAEISGFRSTFPAPISAICSYVFSATL